MKKRILCLLLALTMLTTMLPLSVFAAHDSTGRPLDLTGDVYLALYIGGTEFPGEPAEFDVSGYLNLNEQFKCPGFSVYADSAEGILKPQILDDVVQGTSGVWGVFSTTGGSKYLDPADGIVNEDGSHNASVEAQIIQTAIDNNKFTLGEGESIDDYTIIWYVIKYQRSDSAWHIDGLITKKTTYAVNYYGNGNTSGAAPTGTSDLEPGSTYTVLGNTGSLRKTVGGDTYIFNGWNTNEDGTGVHYDAGDVITIGEENVTLYAEWFLQNKYTVTVVTKLDDTEENVENILGEDMTVLVKLDGVDEYLELEKGAAGTYSTQVTENGTYYVYFRDAAGNYYPAENHQVTIYNQNGRTELLNYSVSYDANAGGDPVAWSAGAAPQTQIYHATTAVVDAGNVPSRTGYTFRYWLDQDQNILYPGDTVTERLTEKTVLTAQWQENIDVTVNVTIDHNAEDGDDTHLDTMYDVLFQLLREQNGVNLLLLEVALDENHISYVYDSTANRTTYTVTFSDLPQGIYNASASKSVYSTTVSRTGGADQDQTIDILLTYAPDSFDLHFDVVVNYDSPEEKALLPKAVNVKVIRWGYDGNGILGWHTVSRQAGDAAPTTVAIDENGRGSGYFPVWKYRSDSTHTYEYRVVVTAFVMPDGSILPASGDLVSYAPDGSGLYTAEVTVEPEDTGRVPTYPAGSNTNLPGAWFDQNAQNGVPTVTVEIQPFTVTFDAGEGTLDGQQILVLENQYRHPDLREYVPVPNEQTDFFTGWYDAQGNPATNLNGSYLTEDVTYYAAYSLPMTVEGEIVAAGTYEQDGVTVNISQLDLVQEVLVVLQKDINGNLVDVASRIVPISYAGEGMDGFGSYRFENVANSGTAYRISILAHNYDNLYDNESDEGVSYSKTEYTAVLGDDNVAVVDAYMDLTPELYTQQMEVDASRIAAGFRPEGALAEVLYRDLGDIHHYNVIAQHKNPPYGEEILLAANGKGSGSYDIWKYHTEGTLYEYQMNISKLYGNVPGVFDPQGTEFNSDTAPYTIEYAPASRYSAVVGGQARTLKATLIPKEYEIIFDMGLEPGETVEGMDQFLTDGIDGEDYYSDLHTWSFQREIEAFPFREGYVFEGWESDSDAGVLVERGGHITVGAAAAQDVVLRAKWRELTGTAYTVRHLELNTDKPLRGAVVVEGSVAGSVIKAVDAVETIEGYYYAGAKIGDKLYSLNEEPQMTVTESTTENIMVIYYLPDSSSGYTEQVESNLKLDKTAVLENNGTYTINLETYTMDNPVTTLIRQNTPLDIVLVLDQSGSIIQSGYLDDLQAAVDNFVELIADHGRQNEVDHRIAMVGYAGDETCDPTGTDTSQYPIAGGNTSTWVNTGVFDSNGDFHPYTVTGFNYTPFNGNPDKDGTYYVYSEGEYMLLTYHEEYRHLITEEQARLAAMDGTAVYGYVYDSSGIGSFVELTRNSSGLWLYGDKQLYSEKEFFTYHQDVWTHRRDLDYRQIHAYGTGSNYTCTDGHGDLYTRQETTDANPDLNVYYDALVPVSVGANGSGGTNGQLLTASHRLGSNGGTYVHYGIEMANKIFEANPLPADSDRVRIMVMFTDGLPGTGTFDSTVANEAIAQAYITKNTHNAYSYTIGLYPSSGVSALSDEAVYMNAVSSNYPNAQEMTDVLQPAGYVVAEDGSRLDDGDTYYVLYNGTYYGLKYGRVRTSGSWTRAYCWYYTRGITNYRVTTEASPEVAGGKVGDYTVYTYRSEQYAQTPYSGYYATTDSEQNLKSYFAHIMQEITTKITKEIVLHEDTILRDIMGQGLVLTPGTTVTAYKVPGTYNTETGGITWSETKEQVAQVVIPENPADKLYSPEVANVSYTQEDGSTVEKQVSYISLYNLTAENATDPQGENYHPHSVDITGYDFENWYISEEHINGYKMVVEITRVEARDDVQWGRSTATNHEQSGLWLPADEQGDRELLLPFEQPTTIFVERAYVLDYGKEFTLSGWYFDDENGKDATPIHVDCDITNGMNWFDETDPNTANATDGAYGNTLYGNVEVSGGKVRYTPVSMNWGGFDQFYVFGNTWRKTVLAQNANENGNLWNKVTVIPANNVYYEDSFITTQDTSVNGIEGFTFTGAWETVGGEKAGQNVEIPEQMENAPYGDVHGWTDGLADDLQFTDDGAHVTGLNQEMGASAEFTFTGTGAEVYTRTNARSGIVIAILTRHTETESGDEEQVTVQSLFVDNLAMSGDYYHIPTVSFKNLVYGTYSVKLIATAASTATSQARYEYYIDGVRIHNPLGSTTNYVGDTVKDAYELETNAVFTEVRDVLLDYQDFNVDMEDDDQGKLGAVFIDWIQDDQGTGNDQTGTGVPSYEIGTFLEYGPKNEVYLSAGQAIVLKVDPSNTYFVGLKSLTGGAVTANVSGIDRADPEKILLEHTTDLYYRVTPMNGYIVIQNGSDGEEILSVTNLRTTNLSAPADNGGILPVMRLETMRFMRSFSLRMSQKEEEALRPEEPVEEESSTAQQQAAATQKMTQALFASVRTWLRNG